MQDKSNLRKKNSMEKNARALGFTYVEILITKHEHTNGWNNNYSKLTMLLSRLHRVIQLSYYHLPMHNQPN